MNTIKTIFKYIGISYRKNITQYSLMKEYKARVFEKCIFLIKMNNNNNNYYIDDLDKDMAFIIF